MSIVSVTELIENHEVSMEFNYHREYKVSYLVRVSEPLIDSPAKVIHDYFASRIGNYYTETQGLTDTTAALLSVDVQPVENSQYIFLAKATYSSDFNPDERYDHPLFRRPEESKTFIDRMITQTIDQDKVRVVNSAGDLYSTAHEEPENLIQWSFTKNFAEEQESYWNEYRNTVNESDWRSYGAEEVLMKEVSWSPQRERGFTFYRATFIFIIDKINKHRKKFLDSGYNKLVSGQKVLITDQAGRPFTHESLLDGEGNVLGAMADPVYKEYRFKKKKNYNNLGF